MNQPARKPPRPDEQSSAPPRRTRRHAIGVREELEELKQVGLVRLWLRGLWHDTPGLVSSMIVHAAVIALLALITLMPPLDKAEATTLVVDPREVDTPDITPPTPEIPIDPMPTFAEPNDLAALVEPLEAQLAAAIPEPTPEAPPPVNMMPTVEVGVPSVPNPTQSVKHSNGTRGLDGRRSAASRARMLAEKGGSPDCEAAVQEALRWLAAHQMRDGGWSFNHGLNNNHIGTVRNPGSEKSTTGATAMALLPFLGAGQTHVEGKYQETVRRGLYYLGQQMKLGANGADLRGKEGGSMYCHGLAAIVLCEAYAMTQDEHLKVPAQQALNFIVFAQDKTGGGWRYTPGQPGDTSVVGWQVMALKSGHLAYLDVPARTVAGAINFLNEVQSNNGANYGYTGPGGKPSTTAIGLLCRMYLGWARENPALQQGVRYLDKQGPSKNNMYYNYYATQIMYHWQGEEWKRWNSVMRDQLISTQVKDGTNQAEKGSWYTPGQSHGERGGRLYETSLSCMTLEVYYRIMPLYRPHAAESDF